MPQSKFWIARDRLLKKSQPCLDRLCRPLIKQVTATQIEIVSFGVISRRLREMLCFDNAQLHPKRHGDFLGHLALQFEKILLTRIVSVRPDLITVVDVHEANIDPVLVRPAANATLDYVTHPKPPTDFAHVPVFQDKS